MCGEDHPTATQISSRSTPLKSLRGSYAPSRMRPKTKRWRKVPRLISQWNGVCHQVRNPLFWCGKPAAANTKTHQQLGGFSPNLGAIHIQLQCPNRAEHVKLLILTRSKGRRMERVKCDHLRAKRCGQDLGNVTRPSAAGSRWLDPGQSPYTSHWQRGPPTSNSFQWRKRQQKSNFKSQYPLWSWL